MLTILYIFVFRVQSPMNNFRHLTTIEIEKQSINNQRGLFDLFQSPRTRFQSAPNLEPFDDWKLKITRFWLISRREKIQKFPNENKYHTRLKDGGRTNWNMVRACLVGRRRREFTQENCHTDSEGYDVSLISNRKLWLMWLQWGFRFILYLRFYLVAINQTAISDWSSWRTNRGRVLTDYLLSVRVFLPKALLQETE